MFKKVPMTGFKTGSSGIGSNRAVNCATTTAQMMLYLFIGAGRGYFYRRLHINLKPSFYKLTIFAQEISLVWLLL